MKADQKKKEREKDANPPIGKRIQSEIIAWFWVGLAFLLINGTIGQARVIPSGSMENTLLIGDHLIMSRIGYDAGLPFIGWHVPLWRNPKRLQIVIFRPPADPQGQDLVKRTIGLPGETLDIHDGSVWINGQRLVESYTTGPTDLPLPGSEYLGIPATRFPYKIPPDCYFVMGDNRGNSLDSRYWGCMPRKNLIGTPVMIYMSLDASSSAWDGGQIFNRFLAYANALVHPGTVRWRRLFRLF
ncbi:MAG: signal peptidase I [Candidatus Acidiferrales bacterium]